MTDADYQKLYDEYISRGGIVHRMPTAYAAESTGALPSHEHRSALAAHHAACQPTYKLRQALRNEPPCPPVNQMERERFVKMGRQSQVAAKERKEKETKEEPRPEMNLSGIGTTRNKLNFLGADQEVTVFRERSGIERVYTTDHAGRRYESVFSPNGKFCGSTWKNKTEFTNG